MNTSLRIGLVMGSTREGRLCDKVTAWVVRALQGFNGLNAHVIDPRILGVDRDSTRTADDLKRQLNGMDGFIIVTPEYNHSFPAPLKSLIDSAYGEWQAKPVAFVSYGALSGGIRAVEQLRQVFAELHTVTIRDSVALSDIWNRFDDQGEMIEAGRSEATLNRMLNRLAWWARATYTARIEEPYDQAG